MIDDIELRAWDERKKIMHYDFQFMSSIVDNSSDNGSNWICFVSDKHRLDAKPHPFEDPFFRKQLKVMRGIGRKDKNGKTIYDQDIVCDKDGDILLVEWKDSNVLPCWHMRLLQLSGQTAERVSAMHNPPIISTLGFDQVVVITNTFETPHPYPDLVGQIKERIHG